MFCLFGVCFVVCCAFGLHLLLFACGFWFLDAYWLLCELCLRVLFCCICCSGFDCAIVFDCVRVELAYASVVLLLGLFVLYIDLLDWFRDLWLRYVHDCLGCFFIVYVFCIGFVF